LQGVLEKRKAFWQEAGEKRHTFEIPRNGFFKYIAAKRRTVPLLGSSAPFLCGLSCGARIPEVLYRGERTEEEDHKGKTLQWFPRHDII